MTPRTPEPDEPALAALGALLDRSLVQIADAARDARTFDREAVRAVSDVWDNTVHPMFWAVTAPPGHEREQRARAALEWMACLRPTRWDWMVEQGAVAGHRIDGLVQPPAGHFDEPYRDHRGAVRPMYPRLTPRAAADLADDYALDTATLRHLRLERGGTRLHGFLTLDLVRSYDPGDGAPRVPPALHVHLDDLTEVDVDTDVASGVRLGFDPHGVVVGLGAEGVLRAREASPRLEDSSWHLSAAGRRADAWVPPREQGPQPCHRPRKGELEGHARGAATFLGWAMLLIRSVRYAREVVRVPVGAYCRALEGAGRDILAAGALPPRRREAAFRSLVTEWLRRGGTDLAPSWGGLLRDVPDPRELAREVRDELLAEGAVPSVFGSVGEGTDFPDGAEPRMVSYTAAHTDGRVHRDAAAMAHLAVPREDEGAPWRMRVLQAADPVRLRVRTGAFDGATRVRVDEDGEERETLVVGEEALTLGARAWNQEPSPR